MRPRLRIDLPPGFVGLPLGDSAEENAANLTGLARRIAAASGQDIDRMREHLGVLADVMAPNRIRLFGRFAVLAGHPSASAPATIAVAFPALPRKTSPAELLAAYRAANSDADARIVGLAAGPAVVAQRAVEYRLPPEVTGRAETVVRPEFRADFQLPAPGAAHVVAMTVTTDSEAAWPAVADAGLRTANSIRFETPVRDDNGGKP